MTTLSDLLTPWIALAVVLAAIYYAEKWIHSHLYGVGWLLTNELQSATILYYLILFPGVFVHEFVQWLVAGALNVKTKRLTAWPQAQNDGTLRLDFVQIIKAGWLAAAIIGAAPMIVGTGMVWLISNRVLNLEDFLSALGTGDITQFSPALHRLASTPDFYLWLYLMFALSNAMLPTPADRRGWPLLIGIFGGMLVFLAVIGVGDVLLEKFTGPVAHGIELLTAALGTVLAVQVLAILVIGFLEEVLERTTKRKFQYSQAPILETETTREPGSSLSLPPGVPLPSIYNLELPTPDPARQHALAEKAQRIGASAPAAPGLERPAAFAPAGPLPAPGSGRTLSGPPVRPEQGPPGSPQAGPLRPAPGTPPAAGIPLGAFDEEAEFASPVPGADRVSPGFQRPAAPGLRPAGGPPRDEEVEDEEQPAAFRRPPPVSERPAPGFQRPSAPGLRPAGGPPNVEENEDEEQFTGFRRPAVPPVRQPDSLRRGEEPSRPKPSSFALEDDELEDGDLDDELEDVDEKEEEDGLEYVDFDDL